MSEESNLQDAVIDAARLFGWQCYHTYDSRRSVAGFPDLTLTHLRCGHAFVELKSGTGSVSPPQEKWLSNLARHHDWVAVWRPCDLDHVLHWLQEGAQGRVGPIPGRWTS